MILLCTNSTHVKQHAWLLNPMMETSYTNPVTEGTRPHKNNVQQIGEEDV